MKNFRRFPEVEASIIILVVTVFSQGALCTGSCLVGEGGSVQNLKPKSFFEIILSMIHLHVLFSIPAAVIAPSNADLSSPVMSSLSSIPLPTKGKPVRLCLQSLSGVPQAGRMPVKGRNRNHWLKSNLAVHV